MTDELKNGATYGAPIEVVGVVDGRLVVKAAKPEADKILRYEVVISRTVLVYAADVATAHARALQVDGVAGRYDVLRCAEKPFAEEPRTPIIDRAPSRETQK